MEAPDPKTTPDPLPAWRNTLHEIIFEADTPAGKTFDVLLLIAIMASVVAASLETVESIQQRIGLFLYRAEWAFTILFTIEYILRLLSVRHPLKYARSFFGLVDLLAILPTYLSLFLAGTQSLIVIRALRLLRIFRVFKLAHFVGEAQVLRSAVRASVHKIIVFLGVVLTLVLILGALMYLVEGGSNPAFGNIPESVYWAIVTMTTVGYGDIAPVTVLGRVLASAIMITGYGIIAVPTGIVTVELGRATRRGINSRACPGCSREGHDMDAEHCKFCGAKL